MRIYLKTSPANQLISWNYQQKLVGTFHKWMGKNEIHNEISLYSLSWLSGGIKVKNGLKFEEGASWFISSPNIDLIKKIISGIQESPEIAFGMKVISLDVQGTPKFPEEMYFRVATPVLIKQKIQSSSKIIHIGYNDIGVNELMTNTLKNKLTKFGISESNISVEFDKNYHSPKRKLVTYKNIENKANFCPVVLKGSSEAIGFAWDVGVGNSTGIGFGALI